jgi:hypothetical protein
MQQTRCKFYVSAVHRNGSPGYPSDTATFHFNAVHSSDVNNENNRFWQATPSGKLEITISGSCGDLDGALELFKPGSYHYLDIKSVPPALTEG